MGKFSQLHLDGTALKYLPIPMKQFTCPISITLRGCRNILTVPVLLSLNSLNLSACSRITRLPADLGTMVHLEELDASETSITEVPLFQFILEKLKVLSFCGCFGLQLPDWFSNLRSLRSLNLRRCGLPKKFHDRPFWLTSLQSLDLGENDLVGIPNELGRLSFLQRMDFSGNNLVSVPNEIGCLSSLQRLDLSENNFNNADTLTMWASGKRFCFINCGQSEEDNVQACHVPVPEDSIGLLFSKYIQNRIYGKKPFEFRFP
ncbi:hypothetical protein ACLB2K_008140 [Fragaria x ananassa]